MPAFSAILYTNGELPPRVFDLCYQRLSESVRAAGGELVVVSWNELDGQGSIHVWWKAREASHRNLYAQILKGIEVSHGPVVFLCEHDVFYSPEYFTEMLALVRIFPGHYIYNQNVLHLSEEGFFSPNAGATFLSNLAGMKRDVIEGIGSKLAEVQARGSVVWAEPGSGETIVDARVSKPVIDIRHGMNFTGSRLPLPGGKANCVVTNYPEANALAAALFPELARRRPDGNQTPLVESTSPPPVPASKLEVDQLIDILSKVDPSSDFFAQAKKVLATHLKRGSPFPPASE